MAVLLVKVAAIESGKDKADPTSVKFSIEVSEIIGELVWNGGTSEVNADDSGVDDGWGVTRCVIWEVRVTWMVVMPFEEEGMVAEALALSDVVAENTVEMLVIVVVTICTEVTVYPHSPYCWGIAETLKMLPKGLARDVERDEGQTQRLSEPQRRNS